MRILVIGAGATGGWFGGRLLQAGRDVTFLVRERRAALLADKGLVIRSPNGDVTLPRPPTLLAREIAAPFDVVLLSCKAYDLADALASFAPAVGSATAVIPLLNGMRHLDVLDRKFGAFRVMGGQCAIAATLDRDGAVVQLAGMASMSFGARGAPRGDRARRIEAAFAGAGFEVRASADILQEMWEKWVFLATLAGATCLMRAPIGRVTAAPGGEAFVRALLDEIAAVAAAAGHPPRNAAVERTAGMLLGPGSPMAASMLRDLQAGARIEADHVIGDLIGRADEARGGPIPVPLLRVVYTHLKTYEAQRG